MTRHLTVFTSLMMLAALLGSACGSCSSEEQLPGAVAGQVPEKEEELVKDSFIASGASPIELGDLPEIRERGVLRVLVDGTEASFLSNRGRSASTDRELVRRFAEKQGLEVQFVLVNSFENLFDALNEGRGDLVAADLTVTRDREEVVAFTRPTAVSEELLIGRALPQESPENTEAAEAGQENGELEAEVEREEDSRKGLLSSVEELQGRTVVVREGSSYETTLREIKEAQEIDFEIVTVQDDPEVIAHGVATGRYEFTVLDSHLLAAISTYEDRLQAHFPLATGRQIAWAIRKDSTGLKASLDTFLTEQALTGHTQRLFVDDLEAIKARGALRVITRNNPVTYFLYRGERMGFDYQLAKMMADELGLRLEMVVAPSRDQLIPWLLEGRGDLIAASLTRTPEREKHIAFSRPYLLVEEWLVQRDTDELLSGPEDLKGKTIHVRRSSSYFDTLQSLQEAFGPFEIVEASEDLETEILIDKLAAGEIDYTVADNHILQVEQTYRDNLVGAFALPAPPKKAEDLELAEGKADSKSPEAVIAAEGRDKAQVMAAVAREAKEEESDEEVLTKEIGFGLRPDNPELLEWVNNFVRRHYRGLEYNMARRRYFENSRTITRAKTERLEISGRLSPYDDIIRRYSYRYGLDWRLMAAVAFQESRFNPKAESWVGAQGLFQVMPTTGKSLGFYNLHDPEEGAHAGIRYVDWLLKQLEPELPFKQRMRFALASYNAGLGHVNDARRLARELDLDPDRWFGNVEKAMLLLQQPKYYKRARHGYVRGSEPVKYVSEIQLRYDTWVRVLPE